jgi:hypothetical protein
MPALRGERFCYSHSPRTADARAASRRAGGAATATPRRFDVPDLPARLRDVASIQELLEATIAEARLLAGSADRARCIFAGLRLALDALDVGDVEARLTALEARLGGEDALSKWPK